MTSTDHTEYGDTHLIQDLANYLLYKPCAQQADSLLSLKEEVVRKGSCYISSCSEATDENLRYFAEMVLTTSWGAEKAGSGLLEDVLELARDAQSASGAGQRLKQTEAYYMNPMFKHNLPEEPAPAPTCDEWVHVSKPEPTGILANELALSSAQLELLKEAHEPAAGCTQSSQPSVEDGRQALEGQNLDLLSEALEC